jgi:amidase
VEASCRVAVERAVAELDRTGHGVADAAPAALFDYADRALYGMLLGPLGYRECLEDLEERLGRPVEAHDVEPFLWELASPPETATAHASDAEIERAISWVRAWERRLVAWFDDYDILVTPTVHESAPELESLNPAHSSPMELLEKMVPHMAFTEPWNATGQPAITLPIGWAPNGCPVGVQLVGRVGGEDDLLAVSSQLMDALGDLNRRPAIAAPLP